MNISTKEHSRMLCSQPNALGGESAFSDVSRDYVGNCAVMGKFDKKVISVLPNAKEAESVACYACSVDGGFGTTLVVPSDLDITHETFWDWMI